MRVTCPQCQLKGSVGEELSTKKARITCARCATMFDVMVSGGDVKAIAMPLSSEFSPRPISLPNKDADIMHTAPDSDTSATCRQFLIIDTQAYDETPVLEIDAQPYVDAPILEIDPLPTPTQNVIEASAMADNMRATSDGSAGSQEDILALPPLSDVVVPPDVIVTPDVAVTPVVSEKKPVAFAAASQSSHANFDRYNLGVQLLRVRPVWLLLSGFVVVSFIIFCSWFIKTGGQASGISSNASSMNHSTNQSATAADSLSSVAEQETDASTMQDASPVATETKTKDAPPVVETVEQASAVQATEAGTPAPAAVSAQSANNDAGKFTVQVGSYSERAQAEAQVGSLQSSGFEARVVAAELPKRGTWYRVQSGRFASRDEATRYGTQLRAEGAADNLLVMKIEAN